MFFKKILILIFFINFINCNIYADEIEDFQIEGMSVGDSLLDYMNEDKINRSNRNYFNDTRKYYVVAVIDNLKTYQVLDIYLKTGDKKYIIKSISAKIEIRSVTECISKKDQIAKELESFFPNVKKVEQVNIHEFDKSNKSKNYQTIFFLKGKKANDPHVRVECSSWSDEIKKKNNFIDTLNVNAVTTEILNWIYGGYK